MRKHKVKFYIGVVMLAIGVILAVATDLPDDSRVVGLMSMSEEGMMLIVLNRIGKALAILGAIDIVLCVAANIYSTYMAKLSGTQAKAPISYNNASVPTNAGTAIPPQPQNVPTHICPTCGIKIEGSLQKCPICGKELQQ